jgi:hypothetical protein
LLGEELCFGVDCASRCPFPPNIAHPSHSPLQQHPLTQPLPTNSGLAAAGTAGGLGTASLTSKEPEALPFCALSYALVGIFSTVIMSIPAVQAAAIAIVG